MEGNSRRDLVLSNLLSKLPHFKRVYCRFPTDIEVFVDHLITLSDFCDHCLEMDEDYTLVFQDESDLSGDEENEQSDSSAKRQKRTNQLEAPQQLDEFQLPPKTKNLPFECYYSFGRMQEIADMAKSKIGSDDEKKKTRLSVAKKLHKSKDEIDAICARVAKGPSKEYQAVMLRSMLLSHFEDARQIGYVVKR